MSNWTNLQIPCKICGASVMATVEPGADGATVIFDRMPDHLEWHKAIEKELQ